MISLLNYLYEQQEVIKQVSTKNYTVDDYKNPPKKFISKFRRKSIIDNSGNKHLLTFAILNKEGKKATGKKTIATSLWHPKGEINTSEKTKKIYNKKEM